MKLTTSQSIIILAFILVAGCYTKKYIAFNKEFNSNIWKTTNCIDFDDKSITPKQYMLRKVIKNIKKLKKRKTIESELGKGEQVVYFKNSNYDLIYCLGPERSPFGVDNEWLLIWFDQNNNYLKHKIRTD